MIKKLLQLIKLQYKAIRRGIAIKEANMRHAADGKRYYVIVFNNKYIIANNNGIKNFNKGLRKQERKDFRYWLENSLYHTA